jgi:hypothetical protein
MHARAYGSCPSYNCKSRKISENANDHVVTNPFIWPYSGFVNPEEVITISDKPPMLNSEPDHEDTTT